MKIYAATQITEELADTLSDLMFQLTSDIKAPSKEWLEEVINTEGTTLFIAEKEVIAGTLTLVIQKTPTGKKAWIEDVVVDNSARGKGVGTKLIDHAIQYAQASGVSKIDLTSSPERIEANKLYQKMGFRLRGTNLYRMTLKPEVHQQK